MNRIQDNCIFIDNGFIEQMTTCPWKANTSFIQRRRSSGESAALRFGKHIHTALAYRNRMEFFNKLWTEEKQVQILTNRFMATPLENEGWRSLDAAIKVIRGYNHDVISTLTYGQRIMANPKNYNLPMVEQPFAVDTGHTLRGHRVIYIGRIDRVIVDPMGIFVCDYKTSSVLGDDTWKEYQMSEQLKGYCWAIREICGIEPVGYIYNVIGARESIANAVWDELLCKVRPEKTTSKAIPLVFESQRYYIKEPEGQLDTWFTNMLQQVDTFLFILQRDKTNIQRNHKHCRTNFGMCEFFNVCSLPERSQEAYLNGNAFQTNEWSPLYQTRK